jgi:hypothetical protein
VNQSYNLLRLSPLKNKDKKNYQTKDQSDPRELGDYKHCCTAEDYNSQELD